MAKLNDAELAANVRAGNVRRSERRRERLAAAGMVQLVAWITTTTKTALMDEAERRGMPIGETAAALLQEALNSYSPAERLTAVSAAMGGSNIDEPGVTMTDNERLYAELDRLSDEEVAALAKEAQEKARAKEDHAYALLGHLNDRRRGVNPDSEKLSTD